MPIEPILTEFAKAAAHELGRECVKHHADDLKKGAEYLGQQVDQGWKRDYEAGGISSVGKQSKVEPA